MIYHNQSCNHNSVIDARITLFHHRHLNSIHIIIIISFAPLLSSYHVNQQEQIEKFKC